VGGDGLRRAVPDHSRELGEIAAIVAPRTGLGRTLSVDRLSDT
jgi:hypothetical protein